MADLLARITYLQRYWQRKAFVFGRGWTPRRMLNFCIVELEEHFRRTRLLGRPYSAFIDPVNICILKCPLCGTGLGDKPRERTMMSLADFVRYVKPLEKNLYSLKLYNYGEPFLNPELPGMIRYANERRISTQVNSNLNRISDGLPQTVVAAGLDTLVVSFDGFTQPAYSAYRRSGNVETVKKNIGLFNEAKRSAGSQTPHIVLQFIVNRHNEQEYDRVASYAKDVGAAFLPVPMTLDITNPLHREQWLPVNEEYTHYDRVRLIKKKHRPDRLCGFLWNDPVINVDGGFSPCCHLFFDRTDFGNLNRESFAAIWNNPNYVAARRIFRERRVDDRSFACGRCVNPAAFSDSGVDLINENRTNNL